MRLLPRALVHGVCIASLTAACASGRVRGGQGTEMQQVEAYEPDKKAEPPEGNTDRTSGPINSPTPPPVLEIDLERRRPRAGPGPEPEPQPAKDPEQPK